MAPLPWIPGAIRERLLASAPFAPLIESARVVFDHPSTVTTPFVTIQVPGNIPLSGGVAWSSLVQVDAYCPSSETLAKKVVWDLVAAAASVLAAAQNVTYQTISYSARVTDGPMSGPSDVSRGQSNPLVRGLIRAELTVHSR